MSACVCVRVWHVVVLCGSCNGSAFWYCIVLCDGVGVEDHRCSGAINASHGGVGVLAALLRYVTDQVLVGRLHNIDLAGSERLVRQSTLYCLSLIK